MLEAVAEIAVRALLTEASTEARIVLVAAHPDDESIGAGSRLRHWRNLTLIHVTDGAPRDLYDARIHGFSTAAEYARAREAELQLALQAGGVAAERIRLEVADQTAALHMTEIARELATIFRRIRPDIVLTHPYEGGHPDHDACAVATDAAATEAGCRDVVWEFTSYHSRAGSLHSGEFLASSARAVAHELSAGEREMKRRMLACFATQTETLAQFRVEQERFRRAPQYDWTKPPHQGTLLYEQFSWGITGEHFRELSKGVHACS